MCESSVGCERNEKGNEIIMQPSLERFIIRTGLKRGNRLLHLVIQFKKKHYLCARFYYLRKYGS